MESGRRKVSSLELRELARIYKRPIDWFYDGDAEPVRNSQELWIGFLGAASLPV